MKTRLVVLVLIIGSLLLSSCAPRPSRHLSDLSEEECWQYLQEFGVVYPFTYEGTPPNLMMHIKEYEEKLEKGEEFMIPLIEYGPAIAYREDVWYGVKAYNYPETYDPEESRTRAWGGGRY